MRKKATVATAAPTKPNPQDLTEDDSDLLASIPARFAEAVGAGVPLFTTDSPGLWEKFLGAIPADLKQTYTCKACQTFVERYGGLVTISEDGAVASAMWKDGPGVFARAVDVLADTVGSARITGVFLSKDETWGTPVTGVWNHFAVKVPAGMICRHAVLTPVQVAAEKREDYLILTRSIKEFSIDLVRSAHRIVHSEHLERNEKVEGVIDWLLALHERLDGVRNARKREAIIWRAAATAAPGWCHVRTTMIGTLLSDLAEGKDFERIKRGWEEKMDPLLYQRPQAAPKAGNIDQAEKLVAQLESAGALARRFARLEDIQVTIWRPTPQPAEKPQSGGVFGHLRQTPPAPAAVELPPTTMTWSKFRNTILPTVTRLEFYAPGRDGLPICALVTAADPAAPPILQWDFEDARNPVSKYLYKDGSRPSDWNISERTWCEISAITPFPSMWNAERQLPHQGNGAVLILKGARDLGHRAGGGFFVESLRSEYHSVRATMEAYMAKAPIAGKDEATACGLELSAGADFRGGHRMRVTTAGGTAIYILDRWD